MKFKIKAVDKKAEDQIELYLVKTSTGVELRGKETSEASKNEWSILRFGKEGMYICGGIYSSGMPLDTGGKIKVATKRPGY